MTGGPRILVSATDPGGAANLAPVALELCVSGADVFVVTAPQLASRFRCQEATIVTDVTADQTASFFVRTKPNAVIVGTTRYDSPDRRLPALARASGVRCVAVLDERYLYRARFQSPDGSVETWPDVITLIDEESRAEAVAEGLPADRLCVTGSPALAALVAEVRLLRNRPPARPSMLRSNPLTPAVTFLSETLSADYGPDPHASGPIGPFIGYTENAVLERLISALSRIGSDVTLIDKRHPADLEALPSERTAGAVRIVSVRDEPLWPLLWHSRAVVGMRSMALLEAALMGVPAVSFQPGLISDDRCTAVRLGAVRRVLDDRDLETWLRNALNAGESHRSQVQDAGAFARADAARRIAALAMEMPS